MTKTRTKTTRVLSPCLAFLVAYALGAITQAWFGAPEVVTVIVMALTAYTILGWFERQYLRDLALSTSRRVRTHR